jgi:serine phosphatase RsbU (regulator of sigma subunit)
MGFLNEALIDKQIHQPNEIFNYVRERLINAIGDEGQQDGFDGILICIDLQTKEITYAASNKSPVIISKSGINILTADKMPVGKGVRNTPFTLFNLSLEPDETLYLYTDGYADQFGGPKGKKFMYKQLNQLLAHIHEKPFKEQKEMLVDQFEDWKGDLEQVDDVCIIGIKL